MANMFEAAFMTLKNGVNMYFADSKARKLIEKIRAILDTKYGPDNPPPAGRIWYATCSTASGVGAKTATTTTGDFVLATGSMVRILFTTSNTAANPTISIDGSTAKNIRPVSGASGMANMIAGGEVIDIVYDGSNFVMTKGSKATTTFYGFTKLSSTIDTSEAEAATPKAVKDVADALASLPYAASNSVGGAAELSVGIPYGEIDNTSTSTVMTATVDGVHELKNNVIIILRNDIVSSASGWTLDVNDLGAKPVYMSNADATRVTTQFTAASTYIFSYNETRVTDGCWDMQVGQVNSNSIGYQLRTNSTTMPVTDKCYCYRLLFTSVNGEGYVPANADTQTSAAKTHTTNTTPINPFGSILYYGSTTVLSQGDSPGATVLWQQYAVTLGYSFNNANAALTLTTKKPVYLRCTPQTDGSAIMDYFTQTLPSTEDGYIYVFLGIATSATQIELNVYHPIYYYKDGAVRLWTDRDRPLATARANLGLPYYELPSGGGTLVFNCENGTRLLVFTASASADTKGMYIVNTPNAGGTLTVSAVLNATSVTVTPGNNTLTVSMNAAGFVGLLVFGGSVTKA